VHILGRKGILSYSPANSLFALNCKEDISQSGYCILSYLLDISMKLQSYLKKYPEWNARNMGKFSRESVMSLFALFSPFWFISESYSGFSSVS